MQIFDFGDRICGEEAFPGLEGVGDVRGDDASFVFLAGRRRGCDGEESCCYWYWIYRYPDCAGVRKEGGELDGVSADAESVFADAAVNSYERRAGGAQEGLRAVLQTPANHLRGFPIRLCRQEHSR